MGEELEEFFLNRKPVHILVSLRQQTTENYASAISSQVDATYSHTIKVLQEMKAHGLVDFEKKGRKKVIELTSRGENIAEKLSHLLQELRD
ncbi:MAG: winged helix DNA-binding protein [Candidatus Nanohaloarchaea archaeon]